MIGMIELATSDDGSFWTVVGEFAIEMVGRRRRRRRRGGRAPALMRRSRSRAPALYPLRMLASAGVVYGAATLVHGSGFLAVFVAGILLGDARAAAPGARSTASSPRSASLAEIVCSSRSG